MSGFSWYVAEGTVGDEGEAMVMGGIGEVDQDILDLGMGGAFTVPDSGVPVFTDPDGGGMGRIGEAIILLMGVIHIPAMDT
jgi:hypothetical protein